MKLSLPIWWYIVPLYLTLWTIVFSGWNLIDGNGMMTAFGVDTGGASPFIMLNSAARYVAIGVAMILGIWIFRTYASIVTALGARLAMDGLDLYAGIQTGLITDITGIVQSLVMFILPNLFALYTLHRLTRNKTSP